MVEARELRIGNWLRGQPLSIPRMGRETQITGAGITAIECGAQTAYEPIPLTAEWLERLGFSWARDFAMDSPVWYHGGYKEFRIEFNDENGVAHLQMYKGTYREIQYVHQLQNLYFGLTGMELLTK